MRKTSLSTFFLLSFYFSFSQTGWLPITSFGSNPGNLNMYAYAPTAISTPAPLVVALHGCTQNAITIATEAGWNTLADRHKFYVVYPEQNSANNVNNCFNWFQTGDQDRGQGEALSIKQMVDYMKSNFNVDTNKIFVTGLSAGAGMTTVMLACYPDIFKKGAVMAGGPYKCATNASQALSAMQGMVTNTPVTWGSLVSSAYPGYSGSYPTVAVFHGSADNVVNIVNENEIMKQWTNIHQTDQTADLVFSSYNANSFVTRNVYNDNNGHAAVETYTLSGMGHAVALDTGSCYQQCGKTGTYAYEVYFSSAFFAAFFFDILVPPYSITGPISVNASQNGVTYSVPNSIGSSYGWAAPEGATITNGQGTNQVSVNFGNTSGYMEVTEVQNNGCKNGPAKLFVTVGATGVKDINLRDAVSVLLVNADEILVNASEANARLLLLDIMGNIVLQRELNCNQPLRLDLPNGVYTATVTVKNTTLLKKLVITR